MRRGREVPLAVLLTLCFFAPIGRGIDRALAQPGLGKPASAASKPAGAANKPAGAASKPAGAANKPARAANKPARAANKPARAASKPARAASKPARAASKPARAASKPARAASNGASGDVTGEFIALQKDGTPLYRHHARAARRRDPIRVDGVLDERDWRRAPRTRMNWKQRPDEGGSIIGESEFRVLYDDHGLYVGVHMFDPQPEAIRAILHRGVGFDKIPQSDWIGVWLDPTTSRRSGYVFLVNPVGVKLDQRLVDDAFFEDAYDAVWEARTSRDRTGWYAEYRIPLSQLRLNSGYQQSWGFQVARRFARNQEFHTWSPSPITSGRLVSVFGDLVIEDRIDVGRAFELLPYVLAGARIESAAPDDRLHDMLGPEVGAGTDFRLSLTDRLKLTGAINPDFGQIEADPSEVNLTSRETFFTERRPLFVSDNELYQFAIGRGSENLFYSRRIGARPHFSRSSSALYVDEPDATTIHGAAKLSGQLPGELTLGLLTALAAEETSRAQLDGGEIERRVVEPMTSYNVAQLGRTFRDGGSDFRLALTAVNRFQGGTGIDSLHREAYTAGAHYLHKFADKEWALFGRLAASHVAGDPAALLLTQRASQRLFQRPDADHLELDPDRTSLSGLSFTGQVEKASGTWKGSAGLEGRSPGFETNDIGFLLDADLLRPWIAIDHDRWIAGQRIKQVVVSGALETTADWAPELLRHRATLDVSVTRANDAVLGGFATYTRELLDTKLLRGGPAVAGVDSIAGQLFYQTATKQALHLRLQADTTLRPAASSWQAGGSATLTWHILSNLELSLSPAWTRNRNADQYITNVLDATETSHTILGLIDQTTLRAGMFLNYTLSPRMSVQLYAEPFISAGRYSRFKQPANLRSPRHSARYAEFPTGAVSETMDELLVDADQNGLADFSFANPDFEVSSLLSNLVYRWEYLPGSTLYLIWSQSSSGLDADGRLASADLGDLFSNHAAHVVLVKLSYWWNP